MPAACARCTLFALRPASEVSTFTWCSVSRRPTALPMLPGATMATVGVIRSNPSRLPACDNGLRLRAPCGTVNARRRMANTPQILAISMRAQAPRGAGGPLGADAGTLPVRYKWAKNALGRKPMRKTLLVASAYLMLAVGPVMAQQKTIKIGFVSTFSGPTAVIGNDMRNAFELALDHMGRKMAGLPLEVIYEDDQQKPEVGKQKTEKLIASDKVDFISGYIWSNVLLASLKPIVDSKTMFVIANAGASQVAGQLCSPYVFSASWENDQTPAAVGLYMNQKGVKTAFLIGPNYAAGKDMRNGMRSTFQGQIVSEELTKWPDQLDFSPELSQARGAQPDAIYVFYPGAAGVQFLNQFSQAGLKGKIQLYTAFTIDELSLPRMGDLALGVPGAQEWVNDLPFPANKSSSRTSMPSTRRGRPSTRRSPMMLLISSPAPSRRGRGMSARRTRCAPR